MENPRLKGVVNIFGDKYGLDPNFAKRYEFFINYLLLKKSFYDINNEYPFESSLDIELLSNINFGKNSTMALDGCIIIHKRTILHLGLDIEELSEKLNIINEGDINVILIQTKSGKFDPDDISSLSNCLSTNFNQQSEWKKFVDFREKCNSLIENKPNVNIQAKIIYVSDSIDDATFNNPTFIVRENALKDAIRKYFWIRDSNNDIIEYNNDSKIYDEHEKQNEDSLAITQNVRFIEMSASVKCSDYGLVRFGVFEIGELMKILYNSDLKKANELYGYNVRDAIPNSNINRKIEQSLSSCGDLFLLLNNGITIVVDKQEQKGEKGIVLDNIRIVNGCQTCHSILNICKQTKDYDNIKVAVRIIETKKENILGQITYSSNNQNKVEKKNLFAIEPNIFELEKIYKDFFIELYQKGKLRKVLLERRQGQFKSEKEPYIDMLAQAKAYISIWNKEPHIALMYAEEPLDKYKRDIEKPDFVVKSLFCGILWYNIVSLIPFNYINGRYQIFTCVVLDILREFYQIKDVYNHDFIDFKNLSDKLQNNELNLDIKIQKACKAIDKLPELLPKLNSGKIHYRKFYPPNVLREIWNKYIEKEQDDTN
ncbi:hypothetical protein AGMMS49965_16780 [Bacteroidia bacterium]|nr:hypothetical protein AGMMS49965_16780 [Bacteroidia bacterium]